MHLMHLEAEMKTEENLVQNEKKECNTTMPHCVSWLLTFCQRKIRKYGWMILKTEFNFSLDYEMYRIF